MAKPKLAPAPTIELSDLARQFLDLAAEERTANDRALTIKACEGKDAYDKATQAAMKAQSATRGIAEQIIKAPVRDLSNLVEKALVAREYCPRWKDGTPIDLALSDLDLTASVRTALDVLSLVGHDDVPIRHDNRLFSRAVLQDMADERRARRRGEGPDDHWRITESEYELIKIKALKDVLWVLADGVDSLDTSTTSALQYVANRLEEHCEALQTTLFGDARELARKGVAR